MAQAGSKDAAADGLDARVALLLKSADPAAAYALILEQLGAGVRGYLRAKTGSDQHGDSLYDALRDSLWDRLPDLGQRIGQVAPGYQRPLTVRAWMYRCASNRFLNWKERRSRDEPSPSLAEHLFRPPAPGPSTVLRYQRLVALIKQELTEAEVEVFILRAEREFSFAEISEVMGLSEGAARQSFHRARQKIKELLAS